MNRLHVYETGESGRMKPEKEGPREMQPEAVPPPPDEPEDKSKILRDPDEKAPPSTPDNLTKKEK